MSNGPRTYYPSPDRPRHSPASTSLSQDDCPAEVLQIIPAVAPVPTRRPILHAPAESVSAPAPAAQPERGPFADWRGQAQARTDELPAAARGGAARAERASSRRRTVARHLGCALAGTLLAIVAIAALSSYAAQGIADARQAALDHARSHVSAPR